jgi:hypothetical protein
MENIARAVLDEYGDFSNAHHLVDVEGFSSPRVCNFLNQLVARLEGDACYLEVGTFRGLTLLSAAINNGARRCVGCDKFRTFATNTGLGILAKRALLRNLARYRERTANITFHHTTSENLFARGLVEGPVGIYFYDGDHSFEATRHGITAAAPLLDDRAVVIIDDWNDPVIRGASYVGLRDAGLEVLWERELAGDHSESGWWNSLGVFFVEKRRPSVSAKQRQPASAVRASRHGAA